MKELLLQEFNFKMNNDYNTLIDNGIEVFSVKTNAGSDYRYELLIWILADPNP